MTNQRQTPFSSRTAASAIALSLIYLFSVGCGKTSPKLQEPLEVFKPTAVQAGKLSFDATAKVDVLVVVDNSLSMDAHQEHLASNIDKFVNAFAKNGMIDYHIGVVPIYDSVKVQMGIAIHPAGHLLPLVGLDKVLYGTNQTPNLLESLRKTIFMGTQKGPEFEEVFSPVLAAMSPAVNSLNQNFYRPEAYLAIIFITDADDVTPELMPSDFYHRILAEKNGDRSKIMASGALAIEKNCPRDPGAVETGPARILEFLGPGLANGQSVSLCTSNFGKKLGEFGNQLAERVGRRIIELPDIPDIDTLSVNYGKQTLKRSYVDGWSLVSDDENNQIVISGKTEVKPEAGAQLEIHYNPVNLLNAKNGRLKTIGDQGSPNGKGDSSDPKESK